MKRIPAHSLRLTASSAFCFLLLLPTSVHGSDRWPGETLPECVGMEAAHLAEIDAAVRKAIDAEKCPGAVVLVSRFGRVVWWRPCGNRLVGDAPEPMSRETVFDMASLTKVMATATSIMILIDRGEITLGDRVARFIPEFGQNGKERITIEQLLRHRGGLVADNPLDDYRDGPEKALERIWSLSPVNEPGTKLVYTDVGYIVLGEVVRRVSGRGLDEFARANIFRPLGMDETGFHPNGLLRTRTAPTELRDGRWMRGEVHDPRAHLLGGVAGHAGLFSTARDVASFAHMILGRGQHRGVRVLSPAAVAAMTSAGDTPPGQRRGLGWDIDTPHSSPRGDLFPVGSFGHTGFTGTSLWIDPASQTVVIILTNRVHPNGKGDVRELRRKIATIVAGAITDSPWRRQEIANCKLRIENCKLTDPSNFQFAFCNSQSAMSAPGDALSPNLRPNPERRSPSPAPVLCGVDVLARDRFRLLGDRRVGLITNQTGVDRDGHSTIDLLHAAEGVKLVALFSPEHGIRGMLDAAVGDTTDKNTGLPIYSLYGQTRKPTAEQLRGIDTLVFDIQDIGCRFYTYASTLGLAMEAAAQHGLKFIVLDRPNPIGGELVEGPVLDAGRESFTGYHRIPVRHGMTLGELARLYNAERRMGVDLEVVRVEGWRRADHFDATGLRWINPSPNMRSLRQAVLYPGIGLLETTNLSVGRGTDTPFEVIGAPWLLDGRRLAAGLADEPLEGVVFVPVKFQPSASKWAGCECGGVQIIVTDRAKFRPVRTGLAIARQLRLLFSEHWHVDTLSTLLAHDHTLEAIKASRSADEIEQSYRPVLENFKQTRAKYLLYN